MTPSRVGAVHLMTPSKNSRQLTPPPRQFVCFQPRYSPHRGTTWIDPFLTLSIFYKYPKVSFLPHTSPPLQVLSYPLSPLITPTISLMKSTPTSGQINPFESHVFCFPWLSNNSLFDPSSFALTGVSPTNGSAYPVFDAERNLNHALKPFKKAPAY